jgi:hypothetical protein
MSTTIHQRKVLLVGPDSIWTPPSEGPAFKAAAEPSLDAWLEPIATIVLGSLALGETVMAGHARKESELRELFARLSILEARALQRRLERARSDDPLCGVFARLAPERRLRLIGFLADARRREATRRLRR